MPVLIFGAQRREVHVGRNTFGGSGDIVFSTLAGLPPVAVITVTPEGDAAIALLDDDARVLVDGASLGDEPVPLRDGATLQIGDRNFVYRAEPTSTVRTSGAVASSTQPLSESATISSEESGWKLIELQTGRIHEILQHGMVIGRDDDCDLVVKSQDVSRRHAVIRKVGTGYTVTDESVNGTFVNDVRIQAVQTLARGDKLRIGTTVFRLERSARSASSTGDETQRLPAVSLPEDSSDVAASKEPDKRHRPSGAVGSPELAALEVMRGPLSGVRFAVTRAVSAIGRTEENDIVIDDESVSSSHATLLLKAGAWYVVDLRSANGTYVDGYRVAAERMLSAGSVLTIGQVKMIFMPASQGSAEPHGTQPLSGMFRQLAKLIRDR
jgi:pSer/pThr/pTyr-binding forkhead associated (FHA) protein